MGGKEKGEEGRREEGRGQEGRGLELEHPSHMSDYGAASLIEDAYL